MKVLMTIALAVTTCACQSQIAGPSASERLAVEQKYINFLKYYLVHDDVSRQLTDPLVRMREQIPLDSTDKRTISEHGRREGYFVGIRTMVPYLQVLTPPQYYATRVTDEKLFEEWHRGYQEGFKAGQDKRLSTEKELRKDNKSGLEQSATPSSSP